MNPSGLDLLFLEVDSLHDSVEFYRDALGFALDSMSAESDPPLATLRAGALRLTLAEQPPAMGRRTAARSRRRPTRAGAGASSRSKTRTGIDSSSSPGTTLQTRTISQARRINSATTEVQPNPVGGRSVSLPPGLSV
jgi:Glyoxalase/Bleomycin resistance protein/Dioxygenase superfamily